MAQIWAKPFYNSKQWKACRAAFIAERTAVDGGMCQTCRHAPGDIVHHIKWLTPENINDPDVSLSLGNLRFDCHLCHNREEKEEGRRIIFDDSGQPVVLPP